MTVPEKINNSTLKNNFISLDKLRERYKYLQTYSYIPHIAINYHSDLIHEKSAVSL